jgi:hypothetical protein
LPRKTYINPWTIASLRHVDVRSEQGRLIEPTTERIASAAAGYLGVR